MKNNFERKKKLNKKTPKKHINIAKHFSRHFLSITFKLQDHLKTLDFSLVQLDIDANPWISEVSGGGRGVPLFKDFA